MKRLLLLFTLLLAASTLHAADTRLIPHVALSQPIGASGDLWNTGYNLELKYLMPTDNPELSWGLKASFHRWKPNAEAMLKVGDRDFRVEKNQGAGVLSGLTGIASYRTNQPGFPGHFRFEGGLGLYHFKKADIEVKGFYNEDGVALNRQIYQPSSGEVAVGVSAEIYGRIANRIEPTIRLQHIFTEEDGLYILTFGIGLLAR